MMDCREDKLVGAIRIATVDDPPLFREGVTRSLSEIGGFEIVGEGATVLAIPVLAGSVGYALGEARKWPVGLEREPLQAKAFYATIAIAALVGACLNFTPINPIKALYWSAVVNGVVAAPVVAVMMLMTARSDIMGETPVPMWMRLIGWLATAVMGAAATLMVVQLFV
ncbi:hypothetical protein MesoLj131c_63220 [Mesorhizobium sp. 131-3-5]|uniref:divalent metal cation transporter n=1 Tax=Mesorhizobium sp. 131-3-5 TaxID=2744520 RepID=UPI001926DD5F|nr:hypothetical protein MesoLj131c_63220 [Mesorhizobium sp. 131-3-5]